MKRNKRILIALALCIAVLVALVLVLQLAPSGEQASSQASSEAAASLYDKKAADLKSLHVENSKGSYTVVPDKEATAKAASAVSAYQAGASGASSDATSSGEVGNVYFKVEGMEGLPVDSATVDSVAKSGYGLQANKTIGATESLADFGLAKPQATVTANYQDGSTQTLLVGSATPMDETLYYVKLRDGNTVYTASIAPALLSGKAALLSTTVTSVGGATASTASSTASGTVTAESSPFGSITYQDQGGSPVKIVKNKNAWLVNAVPGDNDAVGAISTALASIRADSVEALDPDAAKLQEMGLDKPLSTLTYTATDTGTDTLLVGKAKGSSYYLMRKGGRVAYLVPGSSLTWMGKGSFELREKNLVTEDGTLMNSMTFVGEGKRYEFTMARTRKPVSGSEATSSGTPTAADYNYTAALNGKALSGYAAYGNMYSKFMDVQLVEDSGAKPSGTPLWTVRYTDFDKTLDKELAFYASGNRRYLVTMNGNTLGLVEKSSFDEIVQMVKTAK